MSWLSAIFLRIFQNNHVMWNVTNAKFFVYFIDNFNSVYKLICQDNYFHFCVNWWDTIQVFMPLIHLHLLYISSHHPAARVVMSSHTVYSYTTQHTMHICTVHKCPDGVYCSWYNSSLLDRQSGDRILPWARFSTPV